MGHAGLGWVIQGWGGSCRSGLGWVMQGYSRSYRGRVRGHTGVGHVGVGYII